MSPFEELVVERAIAWRAAAEAADAAFDRMMRAVHREGIDRETVAYQACADGAAETAGALRIAVTVLRTSRGEEAVSS